MTCRIKGTVLGCVELESSKIVVSIQLENDKVFRVYSPKRFESGATFDDSCMIQHQTIFHQV